MNFNAKDNRYDRDRGAPPLPGNYTGGDPSGHRNDALDGVPGSGEYQDKGVIGSCSDIPSCLACPLPTCRFDNPNQRSQEQAKRNAEIYTLVFKKKKRTKDVAIEYNLSTRTVHRIVQKSRG